MKTNKLKQYNVNLYIAIFFINLLASACQHDKCKNAACNYGRVIDETTGEGVPHATIDLYYKYRSDSWYSKYEYIKSVTSDSKGHYSLMLDSVNVQGRYALKANQPNYFFDDDIVSIADNAGTTVGVDLKMQPKAWVRLHIKNVNPESDNDAIEIFNKNYIGKNINVLRIVEIPSYIKYYNITANVYRSSTGVKYQKYQYNLKNLDTTDVDIFY